MLVNTDFLIQILDSEMSVTHIWYISEYCSIKWLYEIVSFDHGLLIKMDDWLFPYGEAKAAYLPTGGLLQYGS